MPCSMARPHVHCVAASYQCLRNLTQFSFDKHPLFLVSGSLYAVAPAVETLLLRCSASHPSLCYFRQDLLRYVLHI